MRWIRVPGRGKRETRGAAAAETEVREETAYPSGTLEDFYWGRPVSGTEEDYLWRRLSDNWYQKDVIPSTFVLKLRISKQCLSPPLSSVVLSSSSALDTIQ